jgi:hypothetical protein
MSGFFDGNTGGDRHQGFAFWTYGYQYGVFKGLAVSGLTRRCINAVSVAAALLAVMAYIFQYVSLQGMTPEQVGIWVGRQCSLMLLRLFVGYGSQASSPLEQSRASRLSRRIPATKTKQHSNYEWKKSCLYIFLSRFRILPCRFHRYVSLAGLKT